MLLAGASERGAVAGAVRLQAACGEPDDVGVDRDFDGRVSGEVAWLAGADAEHAGQGLLPAAGGELAQAPSLARDPGASAQGGVDAGYTVTRQPRSVSSPRMWRLIPKSYAPTSKRARPRAGSR